MGYSLLDTKIDTISTGLKFPFSYIRKDDDSKTLKNVKTKDINLTSKPQEIPKKSEEDLNIYNNNENNFQKFKNPHININPRRINTAIDLKLKNSSDLRNNFPTQKINISTNQKSCGLEYERLIKTSHDNRMKNMDIIPNSKLIGQKMLDSDIFFLTEKNKTTENFSKLNNRINSSYKIDYLDSDIFIMKNNEMSLKKIGEKNLFNEKKVENIYSTSSKSNSEWSPRVTHKSLINHQSCEYDIFNSKIKKKTFTKNIICKEAQGINPAAFQNPVSGYVDKLRGGVKNVNKEYLKAFEKDEKIFFKKRENCSDFMDLFGQYQNLCDRPFVKKLI